MISLVEHKPDTLSNTSQGKLKRERKNKEYKFKDKKKYIKLQRKHHLSIKQITYFK